MGTTKIDGAFNSNRMLLWTVVIFTIAHLPNGKSDYNSCLVFYSFIVCLRSGTYIFEVASSRDEE